MTSHASRLKEALAGGQAKDKGPVVADGVLTVTPDSPEAGWGPSVLDTVSADSSFLEDDGGKQPNQLFGKFTWKIDNFSEISNHGTKRELRSSQFNVGECKWYILVYPQGCDVCNHLSLFLCVADYDKLLPGWSHFAQFTIAVVNKDPKKSKYSDTLHRFCKKEHDWGWKKFMELSKVLDGFTVADTLVIKAQVQVILDRPNRPFRCLDSQYRRELVRVYLTNVESICRRFCEEKRQRLSWLRDESGCFRSWWLGLHPERQKQLSREKGEAILKGIVKQFFNEKEVTSTLVMDALFCGCRQLEKLGRDKDCLPEGFSQPTVVVNGRTSTFSFALDALDIAAQLNQEFIPALREDKALALCSDSFALRGVIDDLSDLRRDALERDEKRLAELGRKTVEMFALSHIFTQQLERAYRDYECEQRMRDLIAEEEAEGRLKDEQAAARAAADKEKKAKKRERQRAKKEAERAKREADAAAAVTQDQQEKQLLAVLQKPEQQLQQQQQQLGQLHGIQQGQQLPNGILPHSSTRSSGNSRRQQQQQQLGLANTSSRPGSRAYPAAAVGPSRPGSAGPNSSSRYNSSSNSPLVGLSATSSEALSNTDTDSDSSSSSSSSRGFTPVRRHHSQQLQHQQQQQQSRPGSAHSSRAGGSGATQSASGHQLQQQQQQQHQQQYQQQGYGSSSTAAAPVQQQPSSSSSSIPVSIPTGYAAAVAGMRPPPPAEVTAAAVAMAEQQRRLRDLEEQVSVLKKQVQGLEALVTQKDALIAQKDAVITQQQHEAADLRSQLAQEQQQQHIHEPRGQAADLRSGAAATTVPSSAAAAPAGSREGTCARPEVISRSRGSSRSRGTSADLSDAAAVLCAPAGSPAPWAAVAAGTTSSSTAAATAAAAAPIGRDRSGQHHSSDSRPAGTPATAARPISYAETVSGAAHYQQQGGSRPPSAGSSRAGSGTIAAAGGSTARLNSSDRAGSSSSSSSTGRPPSAAQELAAAAALSSRSSSRSSPSCSPTAAATEPAAAATAAAAGADGLSEDDVPVSPSSIGRSGSAAAAAAAPGPPGTSSSTDGTALQAPGSCGSSDTGALEAGRGPHSDQQAAVAAGSKLSNGRAASAGSSGRSSGTADGLPSLSLKAASAYISNGIAGVLHSSTPLSTDGPATPSFRDSAAVHSSSGEEAAAAGGVVGVSSSRILGGSSSSSSSNKGKAGSLSNGRDPFTAFSNQVPDDSSRGMSFGPMPMANKAGVDAGQHTSQTSILEDNGLDGFVHMNMIDDLLTE